MIEGVQSLDYMRQALVQAALVVEKVHPYPAVGVVVVLDGKVIGKGHNGPPGSGQPHAELQVLTDLKMRKYDLSQAILFTTLEPCCNEGLQPACTKAIIESGIRECHVAVRDVYHLVRDQGIRTLEAVGVRVIYGELEEESRWQNRKYFSRFCCHCGWPLVD